MPLTGGPSDKIPNRYEKRWTIYCIIQVLRGVFDAIYLEPPGQDKAEFVLYRHVNEFHHQAKRQKTARAWTYSELNRAGLITSFGEAVTNTDLYWVFVSGHSAPFLRELTENARDANDFVAFEQDFLPNGDRHDSFIKLRDQWETTSENAYEALKRIRTITIDEHMLKELNHALIAEFYNDDYIEAVLSMLGTLVDEMIHKRITTQDILAFLRDKMPYLQHGGSSQASIETADQTIQQILERDLHQVSELLSKMVENRLDEIDNARHEAHNSNYLDELRAIEQNPIHWSNLLSTTQIRLLCLIAILELDFNGNIDSASHYLEKSKKLDPNASRTRRLEASILARKSQKLDYALELVEDLEDNVSAQNLRAIILMQMDKLQDANQVLVNIQEPDSDTLRLLTVTSIKLRNIREANLSSQEAIRLQPTWRETKFVAAVMQYISTFTALVIDDLAISYPLPPQPNRAIAKLEKGSIITYRRIAAQFDSLIIDDTKTITYAHIWRLACLSIHPELRIEAIEYCQILLKIDPTNDFVILWSTTLKWNIDFDQSLIALTKLDMEDNLKPRQALVMVDLLIRDEEYDKAFKLLEKRRSQIESELGIMPWLTHQVNLLLRSNSNDDVALLLNEVTLDSEQQHYIRAMVLHHECFEIANFTALLDHFEQRYQMTDSNRDLLDLCQQSFEFQDWDRLNKYTDKLLTASRSSTTVLYSIFGSYHNDEYKLCLDLIKEYKKEFDSIVADTTLDTTQVACYEALGQLKDAIRIMQLVLSQNKDLSHLLNLAGLYFKIGDFSALETLSTQLHTFDFPDGRAYLNFADLLKKRNPERAVRLFRQALSLGIPDEIVPNAYLLTLQLQLQDEHGSLFQRFAALAQHGKGVWSVSPKDILQIKQDENRLYVEFRGEYNKGRIPIHTFVDNVALPLVALYHFNFVSDQKNPLHRADAIFARHGSRLISRMSEDQIDELTLNADITAILLSHQLGALEKIGDVFGTIYIPQDMIHNLTIIKERLDGRVQSDRIKAVNDINHLISDGQIQVIHTSDLDVSKELAALQYELSHSKLVLIEEAKSNDGYLVDFLPINKFSDDLQLVPAEIPSEWGQYISSRVDVLNAIQGKLRTIQFQKAYQRLNETQQIIRTSPNIEPGRNLYFDSNALEEFAHAEILTSLCEYFDVYISDHYQEWLIQELEVVQSSTQMANSIEFLIKHLNEGLETDRYKMLPLPSSEKLTKFGLTTQSLISLLEVPKMANQAIWIDDRFANGQLFGANPTVGINDLLFSMFDAGKLSDAEYYEYLIRLRNANIRYVPLTIEEIIYHLRNAINNYVDGYSIQSPELETIRRYVAACMEHPNDVQYPHSEKLDQNHEIFFVGTLKLNIYKCLPHIWDSFDDPRHRHLAALWVRENLYFDYMAMIEFYHDQLDDFTDHRLVPDLASICIQHLNVAMGEGNLDSIPPNQAYLREEYANWVWDYLVEPYVAIQPELLPQISQRVRLFLETTVSSVLEEHKAESDLVRQVVLSSVYASLPEPIKNELAHDHKFMDSIGLKRTQIIDIEGVIFDAAEFWRAVSDVLGGNNVQISGVFDDNEIPITLVLRDSDVPEITFKHPSEEQNRPIRMRYVGYLSKDETHQIKDLESKRYHLDCSADEFMRLVDEISQTKDALQRVALVDSYLFTSITNSHRKLDMLFRKANQGDPIYFTDILPESLIAYLRHFRLPDEPRDFEQAYRQAASDLLQEGNVKDSVYRFASLPIPLPQSLVIAFTDLPHEKQEELLQVLIETQSPVAKAHVLRLQLVRGQNDQILTDLEQFTSVESLENVEAFLLLLQQIYSLILKHIEINDLSDENRLLVTWAHTHFVYVILKRIGHTTEDIKKMATQPIDTIRLSFEELNAPINFDVLKPGRVSPRGMLLTIIGYLHSIDNNLNVFDSTQQNILKLIYIPDTDPVQYHTDLHTDLTRLTNMLGSFLNVDWGQELESFLVEASGLPSSTADEAQIQRSLLALKNDYSRRGDWFALRRILQDMPLVENVKQEIVDLVQPLDMLQIYQADYELGFAIVDFISNLLLNLSDDDLTDRVKLLIPEIAMLFKEKHSQIMNDGPDQRLGVLITNALISPIIRVSATSQHPYQTMLELSRAVVDNWPDTSQLITEMIVRIYHKVNPEIQPYFWGTLMSLYRRT